MSERKELHYRENSVDHFKSGTKWAITIIGLPMAVLYWMLSAGELALAAYHADWSQ